MDEKRNETTKNEKFANLIKAAGIEQEVQNVAQGKILEAEAVPVEPVGDLSPPKSWQIEQASKEFAAQLETKNQATQDSPSFPDQQAATIQELGSSTLEATLNKQTQQSSVEPVNAEHENAQEAQAAFDQELNQLEERWQGIEEAFKEPLENEVLSDTEPSTEQLTTNESEYQPTHEDWNEYASYIDAQNVNHEVEADVDQFFEDYQKENPTLSQTQNQPAQEKEAEKEEELSR